MFARLKELKNLLMKKHNNDPLVSIILPVFNGEKYIFEAIQSIINQTYTNWELIIVIDGSKDNSSSIALSFNDQRIRYFEQENKGVSAARNLGLIKMKGSFFCFLDADDLLTPNSIALRLGVFETDETIEFVDGKVKIFNDKSNKLIREYIPNCKGNPFNELIALTGKCFFGPTWMIRVNNSKKYMFNEELTHGEDLLFYISISESGKYSFTKNTIYLYRYGNESAMDNQTKLEEGYYKIYNEISHLTKISEGQLNHYKKKVKSIMFKSYLSRLNLFKAFKVLFR